MTLQFARSGIAVCALFIFSIAVAEKATLFADLTTAEETEARQLNDYFIRKHSFKAKRYKLVKVNHELLKTGGPIQIPLFDGEILTANFASIDIDEQSGIKTWKGSQVLTDSTEADLQLVTPSKTIADAIMRSNIEVTITTAFYERDEPTGAIISPIATLQSALSETSKNRYEERSNNERFVPGSSGYFRSVGKGDAYQLKLLGMGGPYHILLELNQEQMKQRNSANDVIATEDSAQTSKQDLEKQQEKLREIQQFKQSLGENPHDAVYERRMQEARSQL